MPPGLISGIGPESTIDYYRSNIARLILIPASYIKLKQQKLPPHDHIQRHRQQRGSILKRS